MDRPAALAAPAVTFAALRTPSLPLAAIAASPATA
eukprot:CAMPEP_0117573862 /NCGR_PEP_ID=MMETSP0784-20121206/61225_1 /TAXON_ID=39447 /ORGANISM="" /LENGTH=34 /DNA_ID= /DNA_START= /DNA_END= /DNA_ORIENTATION=